MAPSKKATVDHSTKSGSAKSAKPQTFDGRARMRGGDVDAPGLTRDPVTRVIKTR